MAAHFGLDIGLYSIKLVQAEKKGSVFHLGGYGEVRTPAPISSEAEKDKLLIAEAIKKLVTDTKVSKKNVAIALSEADVFSQVIELPYLSGPELASAIKYEAEQYIPVTLEEVKLEYLVLKSPDKGSTTEKMEVLLVGAKKLALERMVKVIEQAGLIPVSVETEALSLVRVLTYNIKPTVFILDLGYRSTDMVIIHKGALKLVRTLNIGGEAITRAISKAFNMDVNQSEQYKVSYGLNTQQLEGKVAKAILPAVSAIIDEVKRGLTFFSRKEPETKVSSVILSGGGAEMPGLSSYIAKSLNLETSVADPFWIFNRDERQKKIIGRPRFSIAVGLAMRQNE